MLSLLTVTTKSFMYIGAHKRKMCNSILGQVVLLLPNGIAYQYGKSIHSTFHSTYTESKAVHYIQTVVTGSYHHRV